VLNVVGNKKERPIFVNSLHQFSLFAEMRLWNIRESQKIVNGVICTQKKKEAIST